MWFGFGRNDVWWVMIEWTPQRNPSGDLGCHRELHETKRKNLWPQSAWFALRDQLLLFNLSLEACRCTFPIEHVPELAPTFAFPADLMHLLRGHEGRSAPMQKAIQLNCHSAWDQHRAEKLSLSHWMFTCGKGRQGRCWAPQACSRSDGAQFQPFVTNRPMSLQNRSMSASYKTCTANSAMMAALGLWPNWCGRQDNPVKAKACNTRMILFMLWASGTRDI